MKLVSWCVGFGWSREEKGSEEAGGGEKSFYFMFTRKKTSCV